MANKTTRLLLRRIPAARSLSTAAAAAAAKEKRYKTLYRRLSALGGSPAGSVASALNQWVREGRSIKSAELMDFVRDLRKYKRFKHALEVMDWMVTTRGMNLSETNHAIRLELISKTLGVGPAEQYFSNLPDSAKKHLTYGSLLNCYCTAKLEDKASSLYLKMKELDMPSSTLLHNNLMNLYLKLGWPDKVSTQYQEMREQNISPDSHTCCILMTSYNLTQDLDSIERFVEEMEREKKVTLTWPIYSTLASIYISGGHFAKAESALKKLEGLLGKNDREPYNFLLSLYAKVGNILEVKRVWTLVRSNFKKVTNTSYLAMLQALNKLDDIETMKEIYHEWKSDCTNLDVRLDNILIGICLKHGLTEQAELTWDEALRKGAKFDSRTCELFSDHYLERENLTLALDWFVKLTTVGTVSSERVDGILGYLERERDVQGGERVYECLKKLGLVDSNVYGYLLRTYFAAGMKNPLIRERLEKDSIEISLEMENLLKKVCISKE